MTEGVELLFNLKSDGRRSGTQAYEDPGTRSLLLQFAAGRRRRRQVLLKLFGIVRRRRAEGATESRKLRQQAELRNAVRAG